MPQFDYILIAGVWDRLHAGHRAIIREAFRLSNHVYLGVFRYSLLHTVDSLTDRIQSFNIRLSQIKNFLSEIDINENRVTYIDSKNEVEMTKHPCLTIAEGLLMGEKDLNNACVQNVIDLGQKKRLTENLPKAKILPFKCLKDETGAYISSSKIRKREVKRRAKL